MVRHQFRSLYDFFFFKVFMRLIKNKFKKGKKAQTIYHLKYPSVFNNNGGGGEG